MPDLVQNIGAVTAIVLYTDQASLNPQLVLQSNDCGCMIYECNINGEGAIVWSGSAFKCIDSMDELILFVADQGTAECNNGAVKARRNNCTSQLIITDRSLSDSNIECIHFNGTNNVIGNLSISTVGILSGKCTVSVTS